MLKLVKSAFSSKIGPETAFGALWKFFNFRPFCEHLVTGRSAENWPKPVLSGKVKNLNSKIRFLFESANGVSRLKQREKSCFNIKIRQK